MSLPLLSRERRDVTSPGVYRIEVLSVCRPVVLLFGFFLLAYSYGLDNAARNTYETCALSSFKEHSLTSTVGVIQTVIGAAAQPTAAKLADVTSTRSRVLFSYLPALPYIINTWVSGNVASAVLARTSWKWGIGMWALITPVASLPLIANLLVVSRRARKMGLLTEAETAAPARVNRGVARLAYDLFWLLDVVGIVLVIAVLGLILVPFTLAGGIHEQWSQAHIIAPVMVGVTCIPVFVLWERWAPHPLLPFALLRDRSVWAPIGIAIFLDFSYVMPADYLFTVLRVAFDFSVTASTRITTLYSFASILTGPFVGFAVFAIAGTVLYLVAFGLLIRYRGSILGHGRAGMIGAQVLLGIAGGIFPYAAQASMQINVRHEHLASVTGVEKAAGWLGSALGDTVSGALWTQLLPGLLEADLASVNATLAPVAYADPLYEIVPIYPLGTPERSGVIHAYQYIQRILVITGLCLCVPLIVFSLVLRSQKLTDDQTLVQDDGAVQAAHKEIELADQDADTVAAAAGARPEAAAAAAAAEA
ncbi:ferrioxamine B transporter [Sporothrix curviconia]|uniref:Ferrioxamine B transporter n=1 Tax=Sporothrix curviconia TaxID=1260050 RepID=A0ABP0BHR1_9PEZI